MGIRVLRTPGQALRANALCNRLIGTLRRECLDFVGSPLSEEHLPWLLQEWVAHDTWGRPQTGLGPGLPDPPPGLPVSSIVRHELPTESRVVARSILGDLHHESGLEKMAA